MLNIPESIKSLFERDDVRKNFRAHFPNGEFDDITNENVVEESVTFTESVCSQSVFSFGTAEASVLEFETVGVQNVLGAEIEAGIEIDITTLSAAQIAEIQSGSYDGYLSLAPTDIGYSFYHVPYGTFTITSCPRDHQNMTRRQITAYGTAYSAHLFGLSPNSKNYTSEEALRRVVFNDRAGAIDVAETPTYRHMYIATHNDTEFDNVHDMHAGNVPNNQTVENITPAVEYKFYRIEADGDSWEYVIWADFDDNGFDKIARKCWDAVLDKQAQRNFLYGYYSAFDSVKGKYVKVYENGTTAAGCKLGGFQPFLTYEFLLETEGYIQHRFARPQRIYPGKPVICNLHNAVNDLNGKAVGANAAIIAIPVVIQGSATGNNQFTEIDTGGWPIHSHTVFDTWPTTETITRPNAAEIKVQYVTTPRGEQGYAGLKFKEIAISAEQTARYINVWDYYDMTDMDARLTSGELEMSGLFAKMDRNTNAPKLIDINEGAVVNVPASDIEELWWDEYNVDPVGTVEISAQNANIIVITSDGESNYDMKDNAVLSNYQYMEHITDPITERFAPQTASLNFDPVELTMRGLPYVEAGDKIVLTAQDGTTINTYALRQKISGIQRLISTVEAKSGEVVGIIGG